MVWFNLVWSAGYDIRSAFYLGQEKVWFGFIWFGAPVMTSGLHSTWDRRRFGLVWFNLVWTTGYDVRSAFYLGQEKVLDVLSMTRCE